MSSGLVVALGGTSGFGCADAGGPGDEGAEAVASPKPGGEVAVSDVGSDAPDAGDALEDPGASEAGAEPPADAESPEPMAERFELAMVGDIIFGRYREGEFDRIATPEQDVFAAMREALRADMTIANLETPLVDALMDKVAPNARFRFGATAEMASGLAGAGFDALILANNHYNDQREAGLEATPRLLAAMGIAAVGATQAEAPALRWTTVERAGWRVGFMAATSRLNMPLGAEPPFVPYLETKDIADAIVPRIAEAREDHDLLVVSLHWGVEYTDGPSPRQKQAARALIDAGADVVFGHHPHVLHGVEFYGGGVIAYSMGNFVFENTHAEPRLTGVLKVEWAREAGPRGKRCPARLRFLPAVVARHPFHHPEPATGRDAKLVETRLRAGSSELGLEWKGPLSEDGPLEFAVETCPRAPGEE